MRTGPPCRIGQGRTADPSTRCAGVRDDGVGVWCLVRLPLRHEREGCGFDRRDSRRSHGRGLPHGWSRLPALLQEGFVAALSRLVPLPQRNTVGDALQRPAPPRRVLGGQSPLPGAAAGWRVAGAGGVRPGPARAGAGGRRPAVDRAGGLTAPGPRLRPRGAALPPGGPSMAKKAASMPVGGATLPLRGPALAKKAASMALGPAALHPKGARLPLDGPTLRLGGACEAEKAASLRVKGAASALGGTTLHQNGATVGV